MIFPWNTSNWREKHIEKLKESLPEGVEFATLTGFPPNCFKLEIGTAPTGAVMETSNEVKHILADGLGIPVKDIFVTAGYAGGTSPTVLLEVHLEHESRTSH